MRVLWVFLPILVFASRAKDFSFDVIPFYGFFLKEFFLGAQLFCAPYTRYLIHID